MHPSSTMFLCSTRLRRYLGAIVLITSQAGNASEAVPDPIAEIPHLLESLVMKYPQAALGQRREGTVVVRLLVTADGSIVDPAVYVSSGFFPLDVAAVQASKDLHMSPAKTSSGKSVSAWIRVPFVFKIEHPVSLPPHIELVESPLIP